MALFAKAEPAGPNPIDVNRTGLIGKPLDRVDGPLKVTGQAPYAYEYQPSRGKALYGYIVGSTIAKGNVTAIDTSGAEAVPGVRLVMTYENAPKQGKDPAKTPPLDRAKPYLDDTKVHYYGEPVALVVADTFEQAREAALKVKVSYDAESKARLSMPAEKANAKDLKMVRPGVPTESKKGDFESAFEESPVRLDATYHTANHHSNPMELHAAMSEWDGKKLIIHSAHQLPMSAVTSLARTLKIDEDDIRVLCKYVGGGFGSKLDTQADAVLSALAARKLGQAVKVSMTRQQVFSSATHRAESEQRVRLGATKDGLLTAIGHEAWMHGVEFQDYVEPTSIQTRTLYAASNRLTTNLIVPMDIPAPGSVRAPGEAIGMMALEQAMDEMAVLLDMDPIEFRLKNEPKMDPEKDIPFSTRALPECLREGAKRFGWEDRPKTPGSRREGRQLIGYGVASAFRANLLDKSEARVTMDKSGHVKAELAMTDIGTGSYTILTQIAAETMQVPAESVTVVMGDSSLPKTPGSGGSWGANSAGSGLYDACMNLRKQLAKAAVKEAASPLHGLDADQAVFEDGAIRIGNAHIAYGDLARMADEKMLKADGEIEKPDTYKKFSQASYGAHFAEVSVDSVTGEVRLRRMLGVFAAGRILNEKTARSQAIGGMLWGLGAALQEYTKIDERYGHFVNHDYAEYHIPVHADAVEVDAVFLPEVDDKTGPLKIKGVGELGICGAGAAVANAIYNASGLRMRDYPITTAKTVVRLV